LEFYDISPKINSNTAVFPGDQKFERTMTMAFQNNDHLETSIIKTTLHIGAHTDAPSHYTKNGDTIEKRDPRLYLGRVQLIDVSSLFSNDLSSNSSMNKSTNQISSTLSMGTKTLKKKLNRLIEPNDFSQTPIEARRVIFRTDSFSDPEKWHNDFVAFSPDTIQYLAHLGVRLIGIDTPSIDPATSKDLPSHKKVYENNMAILEGIVLSEVPEGLYTLVAIPLAIEGADASPVRALLFKPDVDLSRM
jgi:arylformamidase